MIVSPDPFTLSPLSTTIAVLVTSSDELDEISTVVESFTVLPSVSFPLSLSSVTSSVPFGLLAVATTELFIEPVLAERSVIKYVAV